MEKQNKKKNKKKGNNHLESIRSPIGEQKNGKCIVISTNELSMNS